MNQQPYWYIFSPLTHMEVVNQPHGKRQTAEHSWYQYKNTLSQNIDVDNELWLRSLVRSDLGFVE